MQEREPAPEDGRETEATLIERGAFLVVDGEGTLPLELFDHRAIREERTNAVRFMGRRRRSEGGCGVPFLRFIQRLSTFLDAVFA
jgi:hypothetical protein